MPDNFPVLKCNSDSQHHNFLRFLVWVKLYISKEFMDFGAFQGLISYVAFSYEGRGGMNVSALASTTSRFTASGQAMP